MKFLFWLACFAPAVFAAPGEPTFKVPAMSGPVVDDGGMLSAGAREKLSQFLFRLHDQGGTQIQVLTVPDLGGLSIEEASIKVTDAWKLGSAKADNGILLLLSKAERRVRIEVGQGYEGDLPDARASRIVQEVIIPRFKEGDLDRGVIDGVLSIVHYVNPAFLDGQNSAGAGVPVKKRGISLNQIFLLLFFFFFLLPALFSRRAQRSGLTGALLGYGLGGGFGGGGGGGGGSSWGGGGGGFSGGGSSGSW